MNEKIGRCHDCTAPQTEVNILSRHILELQADKGRLTDSVRELEEKLANADYQLEGRDLEIKELQKENAELKENNKVYCEGNGETLVVNVSFNSFTRINANHKVYYPHNKELSEQLTKAKEIIKELVRVEYADFTNGDYSNELSKVLEQAEQFLNEVGK